MKPYLLLALATGLSALVPLSAATPAACTGPCEVAGHSFGYRPPVAEVRSGADVVFTSVDIGHLTVEQNTFASDPSCFAADANPTDPADPVRFEIVDDAIVATTNPDTPSAVSAPCLTAQKLFDGAYVVPFVCVFHPVLMKGALVVTA